MTLARMKLFKKEKKKKNISKYTRAVGFIYVSVHPSYFPFALSFIYFNGIESREKLLDVSTRGRRFRSLRFGLSLTVNLAKSRAFHFTT